MFEKALVREKYCKSLETNSTFTQLIIEGQRLYDLLSQLQKLRIFALFNSDLFTFMFFSRMVSNLISLRMIFDKSVIFLFHFDSIVDMIYEYLFLKFMKLRFVR